MPEYICPKCGAFDDEKTLCVNCEEQLIAVVSDSPRREKKQKDKKIQQK